MGRAAGKTSKLCTVRAGSALPVRAAPGRGGRKREHLSALWSDGYNREHWRVVVRARTGVPTKNERSS
jgi:hypothetical protein